MSGPNNSESKNHRLGSKLSIVVSHRTSDGGSEHSDDSSSSSVLSPVSPAIAAPGAAPRSFSDSVPVSAAVPDIPEPPGDAVPELSPELHRLGWRCYWSKRENQYYFWNKHSQQSLWEMPTVPVSSKRPLNASDASGRYQKQRRFTDWNLDIQTNVIVYERKMQLWIPPHPEIEQYRSTLVAGLRNLLEEQCLRIVSIHAPLESFNRWLLERKVTDRGVDPLIPSDCAVDLSVSMYREIMNDVPTRVTKTAVASEARKQLSVYAEAAKNLVENRKCDKDTRKMVLWHAEATFQWLRSNDKRSKEDSEVRLKHIRKQIKERLEEVAKPSVESICLKLYQHAKLHAKEVRERHESLWLDNKVSIPPESPKVPTANRKVLCYPILSFVPSTRLPVVDVEPTPDEQFMTISFRGDCLRVKTLYFYKLETLYRLNCKDDFELTMFLPRVYCLLKRYNTLFGTRPTEGHSHQGALPVAVFEALNSAFDITFECFASPLNCYFNQYCSVFPDTDGYFGSRGPFLDFHPISGSFEVNPPFSIELCLATVDHVHRLLEASVEPLSFAIFVPEWRNPTPDFLQQLECSRFNRRELLIPSFQHDYRNGFQHLCNPNELSASSMHGTFIFFLQNDMGLVKWSPSSDKIEKIKEAYGIKPS